MKAVGEPRRSAHVRGCAPAEGTAAHRADPHEGCAAAVVPEKLVAGKLSTYSAPTGKFTPGTTYRPLVAPPVRLSSAASFPNRQPLERTATCGDGAGCGCWEDQGADYRCPSACLRAQSSWPPLGWSPAWAAIGDR